MMDMRVDITESQSGLLSADSFQQLNYQQILSVAQGACFLASGGGGSLQLSVTKMIPTFFNPQTQIPLVGVEALSEVGDWGCVVAAMGSPLKLFADPDLVKAAIPAYQQLAELCFAFKAAGKARFSSIQQMDFCLPVEVGAVNSIVPMIVANGAGAATHPVVVIDADGAGRAVPTLPLTNYAKKLALYPNILGGDNETEAGNYFDYASLKVQDESTLEAACLGMINSQAFGFASGLAIYAANGPSYQQCNPIRNGITDSLNLGNIITQQSGKNRVNAVLDYINSSMNRKAKQIFYGQVTEMKQATEGLDSGYVIINGGEQFAGQRFKLYIENENIWAELIDSNGVATPWIVGPDSMNYLTDDGDVVDNSDLWTLYEKGGRPMLSIIGIQAAEVVIQNNGLMASWVSEVKSKSGPSSYITPWLDK